MKLNNVMNDLMNQLDSETSERVKQNSAKFNNSKGIKNACENFIEISVPEQAKGIAGIENEYRKSFYAGVTAILNNIIVAKNESEVKIILSEVKLALEDFSAEMILGHIETKGQA